ncbi:MAG: ABC transporter permease [Bdellovibrionales bacterium]
MRWSFAFRNLQRNRRRTLATGAAVVAGFVGLSLLGGYILRVESSLRANAIYLQHKGHLTLFRKEGLQRFSTRPSKYLIRYSEFEALQGLLREHESKIDWVGQSLSGSGLISNGERSVPFLATGVDLQTLEKSYQNSFVKTWARDFFTPETALFIQAVRSDPHAISVTKRLAALVRRSPPFQDLPLEQRSIQLAGFTVFGDLNAVEANLSVTHTTGLELAEDSGLLAPLELLQELFAAEGYQSVMLFLKEGVSHRKLAETLKAGLELHRLDLEVYPFDDPQISPNYVGSMGFLYAMAAFFVFLICGAVALSIVNSLTMGILERIREIGTFRAIGYGHHQLAWMMTQEALALTLISSGVGTAVAMTISAVINSLNIRFSPPGIATSLQFVLAPQVSLLLFVFMSLFVLIGITAYVVTYWKLKVKIVDLLTDVGA